jgi:hypothetical protein
LCVGGQFEKKPFDYEIIPASGDVARAYDVSVYPTHVVIDRQGRVAHHSTGEGEDRHNDLRPLIQRLLDRS